jgi:rubrerythrin
VLVVLVHLVSKGHTFIIDLEKGDFLAKAKTQYVCQNCGYTSPTNFGRCPNCGAWNQMVEEVVAPVN